jgi:hypothetical protein
MADFDIVNEDIWPSQNDVAQTPGNGKKFLENQWQKLTGVIVANSYIVTGFVLPDSSGTLNISVPAGQAYLKGRWIDVPGATTITAVASNTNHVFLKFVRDGSNLVTGVKFEVNITGTPPADSTKIGTLVASGSAITSTTDVRLFGQNGIIALTSGVAWVVPAGLTRVFAEVFGASAGGGGGGEGDTFASGGAGTAGGTTTLDTFTATGGGAGPGGRGGSSNTPGGNAAAHGVGSGAQINDTGHGMSGGLGGCGGGGSSGSGIVGGTGGTGGDGGYAAGYMNVTPGASLTVAIGAAGTAGAAGTGGAGQDGGAGQPGVAGKILVHY